MGGRHIDIEKVASYGACDKLALRWSRVTRTLLPRGHNLLHSPVKIPRGIYFIHAGNFIERWIKRLLNRQIVLPLIIAVNSRLKLANCLLLPLNINLAQGQAYGHSWGT